MRRFDCEIFFLLNEVDISNVYLVGKNFFIVIFIIFLNIIRFVIIVKRGICFLNISCCKLVNWVLG